MKITMMAMVVVAGLAAASVGPAAAQDLLTGDKRLACEATLCLSTGTRPSECTASLQRYFSISARKPSDLRKKRRNFLKLCPDSDDSIVISIVNGTCSPVLGNCTGTGTGSGGSTRPGNPEAAQQIK